METFSSVLNHYWVMSLQHLPNLLLGLTFLFGGLWLIKRATEYLNELLRKTGTDATVSRFLSSLVSVVLRVMLLLSIAGMFGLHTTSFIAIFTALTFAVGTALSGNVGHFASGIMLLIFRPYKVGDEVTVQNQTGIVHEIQVFSTTIITVDNRKVIIPNGIITSGVIVNFSHQGRIRVTVPLYIPDDSDFDMARHTILDLAERCPVVLQDYKNQVVMNSYNKMGIELHIRVWCIPSNAPVVHAYFQENVHREIVVNKDFYARFAA